MDILDTKEDNDYDSTLLKYIEIFNLPNIEVVLKGSSQYKYLEYKTDYDLISDVKRSTPLQDFYNDLKKVLVKIEEDNNIYFIELKYQTKADLKIRLNPGDSYSLTVLERHYDDLKFAKLDCVVYILNRFYDISCIYNFKDTLEDNKAEIIKELQDDVNNYANEGFYFKALKRLFSIAIMNNDRNKVEYYMKFFNSTAGKYYEIYCNLNAIQNLYQYYKDDSTMRKIEDNLKMIEGVKLKTINIQTHKIYNYINRLAKKIYDSL